MRAKRKASGKVAGRAPGAASTKRAAPAGRKAAPSGPPAKPLYSAGEAARLAGVSRQVLHNYTVMGLIAVAERTPTNRRYYDESAIRRVKLVRRMLESGYTLQSLRELFPWDD